MARNPTARHIVSRSHAPIDYRTEEQNAEVVPSTVTLGPLAYQGSLAFPTVNIIRHPMPIQTFSQVTRSQLDSSEWLLHRLTSLSLISPQQTPLTHYCLQMEHQYSTSKPETGLSNSHFEDPAQQFQCGCPRPQFQCRTSRIQDHVF